MKESVSIGKEAAVKDDFSPTRSDKSIHRVRNEPERLLGSLRSVIDTISRDGGTPSGDSIATELSAMPTAQRASALLALQRTHGNRYVQRVVAGIQAKLMVGPAGDKYEREADRVAKQVVEQINQPVSQLQNQSQRVQRQELEEEELLQGKFETDQRQEPKEEEEELLQGKFETVQRQELEEEEELIQEKFASGLTGTLQAKEEAPPNKTGMPDLLKSGLENLSGRSMDDVKVHYNSSKPKQLNALAYTQGQDIEVGPGQERHLPHEGWHAVQQAQGRVKPTLQAKGVSINDDAALEREADVMGAKAMQMRRVIQRQEESASPEVHAPDTYPILRESDKEDEPEPETAERPDRFNLRKRMEEYLQPLTIKGETHTIMYKEVGNEMVLGVASNWDDGNEIRQELIHANAYPQAVSNAWASYRMRHQKIIVLYRKYGVQERKYRTARRLAKKFNARRNLKKAALWENVKLGMIAGTIQAERLLERAAFRTFLMAAIASNDTIVATVLGASMPAIEHVTDVAPGDAGNVRYHTGEAADPIPLVWYKPIASYNNIALKPNPAAPAATAAIQPWNPGGNPNVQDALGNNYTFGVAAANQPTVGKTWQNTPKHGKTRDNQQNYNSVFAALGYNLGGQNEDGDHVRDLGFGGNDVIDNFWPLNSVTNRLAFTGWRSLYNLNYKKNPHAPGTYNIIKAPLNSGTLVGKFFRIKGHQAAVQPGENGTATAGSDTGWGAAANIVDNTGGVIPEA